jgi:hypothetical protein
MLTYNDAFKTLMAIRAGDFFEPPMKLT